MGVENIERDRWQVALEEQLKALKQCQSDREISSCMHCPEILGCDVRRRYISAVYESMNKGKGGGFEF